MKSITTVLFLISLILAACQADSITPTPSAAPTALPQATSSPTPSPLPSPSPATSSAVPLLLPAPIQGGTAILGLVGQPDSLNPIVEHNLALGELTPLLFDTLLRVDPETAHLEPNLAQRWEYAADGKQVTFHLPPNLKWSDGTPLTAATIAGSLQATRHPALLAFSEITASDDETLILTFSTIDCSAVTTLAQLPLLPASQILESTPMGSGPFVVSEWSENRRTLTLTRNPNYNGDSPFLDGLTVRFIRESELEIALSEGEGQFDAVGPVQFNIPNPASLTKITYSAPRVIYVAINFAPHNGTPLPPQARQALLLALEREAILSKALTGDGQLMAGSLLPGHWAANGGLSPPAYDPEAARDLLVQAGLVDSDGDGWLDQDGDRLELGIRLNGKNALYRKLGWLTSSYYRDLGLFVRAESVPPDSIIDDLFTHDFSLAIFNWPILPDPDQRLYWHSTENTEGIGLNFVSYDNPELDALLDQGVAVPGCQLDARAKIYAQIQEILSRERPVDFLLAPNRHVLVTNRLSGLRPGPFAPFTWNAAEWYLQE